jgi:AcrR family transcriptional regulator
VQSRREIAEQVDAKILMAAMLLVQQGGWETLTMARVAARAGVTKKTVQHRWATRDQLRASAVAMVFADVTGKINQLPQPWGAHCMRSVENIVKDAPASTLVSWWTGSQSPSMPGDVRDGVEWGWRTLLAAIRRVTKRRGGQKSSQSLIWEAAKAQSSAVSPKAAPRLIAVPDKGLKPSDDDVFAAWA